MPSEVLPPLLAGEGWGGVSERSSRPATPDYA